MRICIWAFSVHWICLTEIVKSRFLFLILGWRTWISWLTRFEIYPGSLKNRCIRKMRSYTYTVLNIRAFLVFSNFSAFSREICIKRLLYVISRTLFQVSMCATMYQGKFGCYRKKKTQKLDLFKCKTFLLFHLCFHINTRLLIWNVCFVNFCYTNFFHACKNILHASIVHVSVLKIIENAS